MGKRIIVILAAMALIAPFNPGTAASKSPKLAKCDGKQRRPANPYGSILPSVDPLNGTSMPASQTPRQESERKGVEVFPERSPTVPKPARPDGKPDVQVPPISGLIALTTNQSC